jgi:membrane protein
LFKFFFVLKWPELFSFYINNFGNYDKTYRSFAAVIILLLWSYITAFIILLGAEINAEKEHQTQKDTTVGKDKPMGTEGLSCPSCRRQ